MLSACRGVTRSARLPRQALRANLHPTYRRNATFPPPTGPSDPSPSTPQESTAPSSSSSNWYIENDKATRLAANSSGDTPGATSPDGSTESSSPPPESLISSSSTPPESPNLPTVAGSVPATTNQPIPPPSINPFHTHKFYKVLEATFSPPLAKSIMKATRAALIDRMTKTRRDALDVKDFHNSAYLFRAALSELRTELTLRTRKETATLRTALTAVRKDVDLLDAKMKEDIATLKHEIQMDMNNRNTESRAESKAAEVAIEEFNHKTIVIISDLRTEIEQAKWDNTRRGITVIIALVIFVIVSMELAPKAKPPPPPAPPQPVIVERPLPSIRALEHDDSGSSVEEEGI
ncbi:hypothetical protein FRC02_004964 [Tulasnella sp. 418]|nr:hypothetical protein FRC02_004964 [Tulasnella sp. 418]